MNIKKLILAAIVCSGISGAILQANEKKEKEVTKVQQEVPKAQKVSVPGVTLINPEKTDEAVLLVQVATKGPDGKVVPQLIGVKIKADETGKKLIKEYGVKSAKPGDVEGAKTVQKAAQEKFVMVNGVIDFASGRPVLTVNSYKSAKELLAKVNAADKVQKNEVKKN